MVVVSDILGSGQVVCRKCGNLNDFGSGESLFHAELHTTCSQCGFRFLEHIERQMFKLLEMMEMSPEWNEWFRNGRNDVIRERLNELVPLPTAA
jgi:hypothetical protein